MHPSAYTQRQNAAYARIQAAEEYLAGHMGWPEDTPKVAGVSHPDANMRALLKLEAAAGLVVRAAQDSGYEEPVAEPFKPNEFIVPPDQAAPALAPLDESVEQDEQVGPARKTASKHAAKSAAKTAGRRR